MKGHPHRPDIHSASVILFVIQHLWGSVTWRATGSLKKPAAFMELLTQSKIYELENVGFTIDDDVFRLDVTMADAFRMEKLHCVKKLTKIAGTVGHCQLLLFLLHDHLVEFDAFHELSDDVQVGRRLVELEKSDDVGVLHFLQDFQFLLHSLKILAVVDFIFFQDLYCNFLSSRQMQSFFDFSESPTADSLAQLEISDLFFESLAHLKPNSELFICQSINHETKYICQVQFIAKHGLKQKARKQKQFYPIKETYPQRIQMMSNSRSQAYVAGSNPRLEEWALISQAKALEYERMKEMELIDKHNKKIKFRQDLDKQISQKGNSQQVERDRDQEYFNHIMRKGEEQGNKQHREKRDRQAKRMQMEEENRMIIEDTVRCSRSRSYQNQYKLDIGLKSELQQKEREEKGKREMILTLQQQLRNKKQQAQKLKMQEIFSDIKHNREQAKTFEYRNPNKNHQQDQRVYDHYQGLMAEKRKGQEQFQRRIIDEAAQQKQRQEQVRENLERRRREEMASDMKQTLEQQVRIHNYKKHSQKVVNPEQVSFQFISDLYRDHPPSYNKYQYQEQLRKQAQEQRNKKRNLDFMSEEEYKLNVNQLNKIVTGNYTYDQYVDRSLGAIGERKVDHRALLQKDDDPNAEFVRNRLESLRNRKGGGLYSRLENSALI